MLSILLYMSQLPLMRRLVREGDATLPGYSYLPVLGQIAQAGPWCGYAICIQPTVALLTANFVGVGLGFVYLLVFAVYTPTWIGRLTIAASGSLVCGAIVAFYVRNASRESRSYIQRFATLCHRPQALLFSPATGPAYAIAVQIAGIATVVVNQGFWVVPFLGLWRAARTLDTTRTSLALSGFQVRSLRVRARGRAFANRSLHPSPGTARRALSVGRLRGPPPRRVRAGQLLHRILPRFPAVLRHHLDLEAAGAARCRR